MGGGGGGSDSFDSQRVNVKCSHDGGACHQHHYLLTTLTVTLSLSLSLAASLLKVSRWCQCAFAHVTLGLVLQDHLQDQFCVFNNLTSDNLAADDLRSQITKTWDSTPNSGIPDAMWDRKLLEMGAFVFCWTNDSSHLGLGTKFVPSIVTYSVITIMNL